MVTLSLTLWKFRLLVTRIEKEVMSTRYFPEVFFVVFTLSSCCAYSGPIAISTFDADRDGWTVQGDAPATPNWVSTGGNPGGYIMSTDDTVGGIWYWEAPFQYLGDVTAAFDGTLSYDLRQSDISEPFDSSDVILSNGIITISLDHSHPGTEWTSYLVPLNSTANWRLGDENGPIASDQDIFTVLGNLQSLRIRGEYRVGPDFGGLDNVIMTPEPTSFVLLVVLSGVLIRRRH